MLRNRRWVSVLVGILFLAHPGVYGATAPPADSEMAQVIEHEFLNDEAVSDHLIGVNVDDGVVTLEGSVMSVLDKERAQRIAESIRGVRSVVNRIVVNPPQYPDDQLLDRIERALMDDPATDVFDVTIAVDKGRVTLTGIVHSWQEKQLAGQVAKGVVGVRALDNQINVDYLDERPDRDIKADIQQRLKSDVWVRHSRIRVQVNEGDVKLTGQVGSAIERRQAVADAWVANVKDVDAAGLEVDPGLTPSDLLPAPKSEELSDAKVERNVLDAFSYDPRLQAPFPKVAVQNGIVRLRGTVDSLASKRAAEQDARNSAGVLSVRNYLKVRPEEAVTSRELQDRVKMALRRDPIIEKEEIAVSANQGIVYLMGKVDTRYEKAHAEYIASKVKGVVEVENNLSVEAGVDLPYSFQYSGSPYLQLHPSQLNFVRKPDRKIREQVENQLFWSPFVDADEVEVEVDDGVVTLRGTVESWVEYSSAQENAYEGGATAVINELEIEPASSS